MHHRASKAKEHKKETAKGTMYSPLTKSKSGSFKKDREVKTVTLLQGVALIIGVMIGSGIFVSPRYVLEKSGSIGMMIVVWILCGMIALLGSLCYCELGAMIQESGGEYIYIKEAYGHLVAFLVSWTVILVLKPASIAIICMGFAYYSCLPFLPEETSEEPTLLVKFIAMICIIVLTVINCISTKLGAQTQVLFTSMKLLAVGLVVIIGAYNLATGHTQNFQNVFKGTSRDPGQLVHAFYSGLWAFDGWNALNYVAGDLQNPAKNLPRAMLMALPLVTLCYVLVNIAYLSVLTPAEIISSSAVAVSFGEKLNPVFLAVMPLLVACSCFGAANGSVFTNSKVVCAAAKENHMPSFLASINSHLKMPIYAVSFPSCIAILLLIPSNLESLISCFSFAAWLFYGGTISSLLVLRYKLPNKHRPYKVWTIIPVLMVMVALYLVIAPFVEKPKPSLIALAYILSGIPFYYIFARKK
ncbi:b(0,+)-type amino acid transporter 1 [Exaiptasia diaphana]|uniref:b(0,+)-type amino acid transporter 1 n=1 Tax=Exaiptasia diaphana TaxID=2652724 RepID=A0A913XM64_EXADI|nr:b(0,+)-type amino acid transporter 1 [Exaiptasia diaphana]KXJ20185.1 b(0,+)-type amino acid transporter 1 [Exaiptasia diaphana]